ncbi:hypothetical protein D3Z36_14560 [Lachnospiraceae bacterium]|nr:hypothetical protein [Lachnospiraceae bacterium]
MKNIEQILKDAGIEVTDEQKAAIVGAVKENYKTIADYDKQVKKTEAAETDRDAYKGQLDTANETLEKFKDIDPDKQAQEIEKYKQAAREAQDNANKRILERDQRDWLNREFDEIGVKANHTREYYSNKVMDEKDGLKWKEGAFVGFRDYLAKENEKDHFYQTEAEKAEAEAKEKAAGSAPKFTDKSEGKKEPAAEPKSVPKIW